MVLDFRDFRDFDFSDFSDFEVAPLLSELLSDRSLSAESLGEPAAPVTKGTMTSRPSETAAGATQA